jgi:hypothetical protein
MTNVNRVERRIETVEGFGVRIRRGDGRDVRSDKRGLPQYTYKRMAKGKMLVSEWKLGRFAKRYSGYRVDVLDGRGRIVQGNTRLSKVRESYGSR